MALFVVETPQNLMKMGLVVLMCMTLSALGHNQLEIKGYSIGEPIRFECKQADGILSHCGCCLSVWCWSRVSRRDLLLTTTMMQ